MHIYEYVCVCILVCVFIYLLCQAKIRVAVLQIPSCKTGVVVQVLIWGTLS